jgi:hypothetical protein
VLLALITAISVLWTRLQHDSEILPEGFQSTTHETVKFLPMREGNMQENELTRKRERSGLVRTPRPILGYSVTTKAKVVERITEMGLLQRLKEVNIVLTYVNVFSKAKQVQSTCISVFYGTIEFSIYQLRSRVSS